MTLVVDASVAMKWFVEEISTEHAVRLLEHEDLFCAPDLIIPEITNIAWKKAVRDEITNVHALEIAKTIQDDALAIYPSILLNDRALEIALSLNHPVYDCLYVACAEAVGGMLITADRRFSNVCRGGGFDHAVACLDDVRISENGITLENEA